MSIVRFISDYHFGHNFMANLRGFPSTDSMNEYIINEHNKVVNKKDLTYILGDISMENSSYYSLLGKMKGRKIVILGNHFNYKHLSELLKYVEGVSSMIKYKGIFLTHCPIHPQELQYRVSYNIHGHTHENNVKKVIFSGRRPNKNLQDDTRYINVSCEVIDYKPKTLEELIPNYRNKRK